MSAGTARDSDVVARADERVTRMAEDARRVAQRVVGRVREELEDVWAEARSERGERPTAQGGR